MSNNPGNGWHEHQRLVLYRLDQIDVRLGLLEESVRELLAEQRVRTMKVIAVSFGVSASVAFGAKALVDVVMRLL